MFSTHTTHMHYVPRFHTHTHTPSLSLSHIHIHIQTSTHTQQQDSDDTHTSVDLILQNFHYAVALRGLYRGYGKMHKEKGRKIKVLQNMDMTVPLGAIYGLLGPSGMCAYGTVSYTLLLFIYSQCVHVFIVCVCFFWFVDVCVSLSHSRLIILSLTKLNTQTHITHTSYTHTGCGKTTLLKVLTGRLRPDKGVAHVFGCTPHSLGSLVPGKDVGYMPQELALYPEFTIAETLLFYSKLHVCVCCVCCVCVVCVCV